MQTKIVTKLMKNGIILALLGKINNPLASKEKVYWIGFLNDKAKTVITGPTRKSIINYINERMDK